MALIKSALATALRPLGLKVEELPPVPAKRNTPRIVLATVPRSGSMFLIKMLALNLKLERIDLSPGYFPVDNIDLRAIVEFSKGGYIAQGHINPSPFNLNLIKRFTDKCIIQLRDPRAALYSWTLTREWPRNVNKPHMWFRSYPTEPDDYSSMNELEKLDWQIDNYLPVLVNWIVEWCAAVDSGAHEDRLILTTQEQLTGRDVDFVKDLFERIGISVPQNIELPPKDQSSHFRKGLKNEWRNAFSLAQIDRATNQIPRELMARFGWDKH